MADWWRSRSRRARLVIGAAAVLFAFGVIGSLVDAEPSGEAAADEAPPQAASPAPAPAKSASRSPASKPVTSVKRSVKRTVAVSRVIDGHTIELANGTVVRLVQIDAPEVGSSECYAGEATATLKGLLPSGRKVALASDPTLDQRDRYGRRLAYVFKGTELIQETLIARGAASPWFFDGDRGRYAGRLMTRANQAKSAGLGLWGACPGTKLDPTRALATVRPLPKPTPAPQPEAPAEPAQSCHPSYEDECLDPGVSDYDCAGGSGDGPGYVSGTVRVVGPDDYGLDRDGDGYGCDS